MIYVQNFFAFHKRHPDKDDSLLFFQYILKKKCKLFSSYFTVAPKFSVHILYSSMVQWTGQPRQHCSYWCCWCCFCLVGWCNEKQLKNFFTHIFILYIFFILFGYLTLFFFIMFDSNGKKSSFFFCLGWVFPWYFYLKKILLLLKRWYFS